VVISRQSVVEGGGEATIDLLPGFNQVEITRVTPYGRVTVVPTGANSLVITNTGGSPVNFVEVTWRVRQ
jgi:hypothetical protein